MITKIVKNSILSIVLSCSFLNINAQERKYVDDGTLYTKTDGLVYRDSIGNRFYKLGEYIVPFTVSDLAITIKEVEADVYYQISGNSERDTVALVIGTSDKLNYIKEFSIEDSKRIYAILDYLTTAERIKLGLTYVGKLPELSIMDLDNGVRPCKILRLFEKLYVANYGKTPKHVFITATALKSDDILYSPFFVRFNKMGTQYRISTYDWNILHEEKLPIFRLKTFKWNGITEICIAENAICFKVGWGELHFFRNVYDILRENGFKATEVAANDLKEFIASLPLKITELRPIGEIAQYYDDFIKSGRSYIAYK